MPDHQRRSHDPLEIVEPEPSKTPSPRVPPAARFPFADYPWPTLRASVDALLESWWRVAVVVGATLLAGGLYLFLSPPQYLAEALVQVEQRSKGTGNMEDIFGPFDTGSEADTEIEIIRSRTLLGGVVDELNLDVEVQPRYLPLFGRAIALRRDGDVPASPVLGLKWFGWGGEHIRVDRFDPPLSQYDRPFTLVALGEGRYDLRDPAGQVALSGVVGKPAAAPAILPAKKGIEILVSELEAREGTAFRLARRVRSDVIDDLLDRLKVAEKGEKGKKTGVIRLAISGSDPPVLVGLLDGITKGYLRRNVQRKSAEAEKTLEFISAQLPQLRANLNSAEQALRVYRSQRGHVDMSLETKAALDRLVALETEYTAVELQASEAKQRFTLSHPSMEASAQKLARLTAERARVENLLRSLPNNEMQSARLMRDTKLASELYTLLTNKAQELQLVKNGTVGNVVILDSPSVSRNPVEPVPRKVMTLSLLLGLTLGVAWALVRRSLLAGVEDPLVIERELGIPVYASIPHSPTQAAAVGRGRSRRAPILAVTDQSDLAIEAIRSLRTSVQFALTEARNNVVAITGPGPGVGKSFVSVNLAHVLASAGARVLLIDGDLRKGSLHGYFITERSPGLSDLIRGPLSPEGTANGVRQTSLKSLSFLPMGEVPPNPSELLISTKFQALIDWASRSFDVVLIDTAPILAVTDGILEGRAAGTSIVVLNAGQHPLRELLLTVKQMVQNGVQPHAFVVNTVKPRNSLTKYHYRYDYR